MVGVKLGKPDGSVDGSELGLFEADGEIETEGGSVATQIDGHNSTDGISDTVGVSEGSLLGSSDVVGPVLGICEMLG